VGDYGHEHLMRRIVYFVDDPPIADAESVGILTGKFDASMRPRLIYHSGQFLHNARRHVLRYTFDSRCGRRLKGNGVRHI
jgi:hypothetical protein